MPNLFIKVAYKWAVLENDIIQCTNLVCGRGYLGCNMTLLVWLFNLILLSSYISKFVLTHVTELSVTTVKYQDVYNVLSRSLLMYNMVSQDSSCEICR